MADFGAHMTVNNIVALILGIIGLIWLIHGLWRNWKINKISTWPKTNAVVLNAVAEPANNNAGNVYIDPSTIIATTNDNAQYIPRVVYRYRVGNRDYQSTNVVYSGAKSYNALDIKTLLGQVYPGATIPIYYNPNNHAESYIYNGNKSWTGVIIGLALLLIAAYLAHRNHKNQTVTTVTQMTDASPSLTDIDISTRNGNITRTTTVPVGTTRTITKTTGNIGSFYRRDFY